MKTKPQIDDILKDPVAKYEEFSLRLKTYGPNASFPEFKAVVDEIWTYLQSEEFNTKLEEHALLRLEHQEVLTMITHLNLSFSYEETSNYPYLNSYSGIYPYRPTLDAIEAALRLCDKIERLYNKDVVPLYHFDRYAYHRNALWADEEIVIFPTSETLTFMDLIKVHSVPIGLVGVSLKTIRVDRYWQSPLDFWYHDLNHVRRMCAYLKTKVKAKSFEEKIIAFKEMDKYISSVLIPNLQKLPKGASEEEVALRKITRLLIFEILHESAVVASSEAILKDLVRSSKEKTPFEVMSFSKVENIESLRTATGNVQSGAQKIAEMNPENKTAQVHYYWERDLGLLANVYNKINFGYYDEPEKISDMIVPSKFRKAEHLVAAVKNIFSFMKEECSLTHEELIDLVLSKEGKPELFSYQPYQIHEGDLKANNQMATEPISGEAVIELVKKLGKKVYTLFGFSYLGYEDNNAMLKAVEEDLKKLNPLEVIISIGATSEGIGQAYEIARRMGFETIGIVSMRALSYSGHFSKFVDKIYIINDKNWGGFLPGSSELTPTTKAFVETSEKIFAYGGGHNSVVAVREALKLNKEVEFKAFDFKHNGEEQSFKGELELWWKKN